MRIVKIIGGNLDGSAVVRCVVFGREPEGKPDGSCKQRLLTLTIAVGTLKDQEREGGGLHDGARHCPDGDEGHGVTQKCGGDAQLHAR